MGMEEKACRAAIEAVGLTAQFEILKTGIGAHYCGPALEKRLREGEKPSLIVSSGFAGGLTHGMKPLQWITAEKLFTTYPDRAPEPVVPEARPISFDGVLSCSMISAAELTLQTDTNMGSLGTLGERVAVDMETATLAKVAARHKIPFSVLRMLSDGSDAVFPAFLIPITASFATPNRLKKITYGVRGALDALKNPKAVAKVFRDSRTCSSALRDGWIQFAPKLLQNISNL